LYPNPAGSYLMVEAAGLSMANLSIFATDGKLVLQMSGARMPAHIGIETLPAGAYWLKLETSHGQPMKRFIKL
jgi:hypothetical protein